MVLIDVDILDLSLIYENVFRATGVWWLALST